MLCSLILIASHSQPEQIVASHSGRNQFAAEATFSSGRVRQKAPERFFSSEITRIVSGALCVLCIKSLSRYHTAPYRTRHGVGYLGICQGASWKWVAAEKGRIPDWLRVTATAAARPMHKSCGCTGRSVRVSRNKWFSAMILNWF